MFELFTKPIKKQIELYISWKEVRHPLVARSQYRILRTFFDNTRVKCATEITPECLKAYCDRFPAQYQKLQFIHTVKQFSKYWCRMGLLTNEFTDFMRQDTILDIIREELSPTMHINQVRRVRQMRKPIEEGGLGYSLNQCKLAMETEDGKPYHLKQVHRWSKYILPEDEFIHRRRNTP